jgi:2-C-methyl-D-erythritol 4-phosphate cytidylyltransferase
MTNVAVIVAAGRGERMGLPDKVLLPIAGTPVIVHSLCAALASPAVNAAVIVAGAHTLDAIEALVPTLVAGKPIQVVTGGARRQDSVLAGIRAATGMGAMIVAVHDGARPLVPSALFDATIEAAREQGGAIAAVPVADSLKRVEHGVVAASVSRDYLWAAQTPQSFAVDRLLEAFEEADRRLLDVTDESGLFEALGWPVGIVEGDPSNMKLTRASDIPMLEALYHARNTGSITTPS